MPCVLITGANRGIGLEFARSFATDGWRVHACCRQPEKARNLKALAGDIVMHRLDVTDGLRAASLAREMDDEPIDILINNAGVYGAPNAFGKTPFDKWAPVFEVNTIAPLRIVRRFVEQVARSERKLVVNIGSRMGSIAENNGGGEYIYRSSKAALNMVVKSMSIDLAGRGITVVVFHPGWVRTDMGGPSATISTEESVAGMRQVIEGLTTADNGRFFNYEGDELPW